MKAKKICIQIAIGMLSVFSISATHSTETVKPATETKTALNPCGVGAGDVVIYLESCSHHHKVYSVSQISGSCNFSASIENCQIATVYVEGGSIVGHLDSPGICQ